MADLSIEGWWGVEVTGDGKGELYHAKNVLTLYATHNAFNEALIENDRWRVR